MKLESFLRLPREVAQREDLTATAKLVMAALHGRAWGEKDEAWPSIATIGRDIGESPSAVKRALSKLVKAGLVTVVHRQDEFGQFTSNLYRLPHIHSSF